MSARWICVIGGGRSQVPFIEAARRRGLATIVFDRDPQAAAVNRATKFVALSTHDTAGVLDHLTARPRALIGCFTYSSFEGALATTAAVVDHFRLPGLTSVAVARTSSKLEMRRHLDGIGVVVPEWLHTDDPSELALFVRDRDRVITKPARGGVGSAGVALLEPGSDVDAILAAACAASSDGSALVESFVEGPEYSVDGYVVRGEVRVLCVSRKHTGVPDAPHVMSGFVAGEVAPRARLEALAGTVVEALGLDNTYFSLDVIDSGDGLCLIDAGPLLDAKIDRLLDLAGVDVYGIPSDIALGDEVAERALPSGWHALRFVYASEAGVVRVAEQGRVGEATVELERRVGEPVVAPSSVSDVVGWSYAAGVDRDVVWASLEQLDLTGRIEIGPAA